MAVSLSSSLPSLLTVPAVFTVPAGAASAAFTASAAAIATAQGAVITATLGTSNLTAAISLLASAPVTQPLSLSCTPTVLTPGISGSCVVSLATPQALPTVVTLKASNPAFTIPASLTIPIRATSAPVSFTTTSALTGAVSLMRHVGQYQTNLHIHRSQVLTATPSVLSLSCAKRIASGSSGVCDLQLSPSGTSPAAAISLTSSSRHLKVPETLLSEPGQTTIRFQVAADPDAAGENAILEATAGDTAVRESLAVGSSGPHLLAPGKVAGMPATGVHFRVSASGGAVIAAAGLPPGSVFDANIGAFDWTPPTADLGEHQISFIATDAQGARTTRSVVVYIGTGAPVLTQLRNLAGGAVCSPGAIASISGWFLSHAGTSLTDRSGRSSSLGETRVLVNGAYAPILSASTGQVEFLCPVLPARTPLDIAVETPSGQSNSLPPSWRKARPPSSPWMVRRKGTPWPSTRARANWRPCLISACAPRRRLSGERISVRATGIECAASPQLRMNLGGQPVAVDSAQPVSQMAGICEVAFRIPGECLRRFSFAGDGDHAE